MQTLVIFSLKGTFLGFLITFIIPSQFKINKFAFQASLQSKTKIEWFKSNLIITLMKTVWGWFSGTKDSESHFHNKANTKAVCCSDFCKQADRYICSDTECIQKHRGHLTMQIK